MRGTRPRRRIKPDTKGIQLLPAELLGHILIFYYQSLTTRRDIQAALTVVRQTCQLWNIVALSLPELWSTIDISITSLFPTHSPLPSVRQWLDRSKGHPLCITFTFRPLDRADDASADQRPVGELVLELLFVHFHRWQSVVLNIDGVSIGRLPMIHISTSTALKSVELFCDFNQSNILTSWYGLLLTASPHVRQFTNHGLTLQNFPNEGLHWGHLTTLKLLGSTSLPSLLEILNKATRLHACNVNFGPWSLGPDGLFVGSTLPISCPLRSLCITSDRSGDAIGALFRNISTSQIEHFEIRSMHSFSFTQRLALTDFLRASTPTLTTFLVETPLMTDTEILQFLETVTSSALASVTILVGRFSLGAQQWDSPVVCQARSFKMHCPSENYIFSLDNVLRNVKLPHVEDLQVTYPGPFCQSYHCSRLLVQLSCSSTSITSLTLRNAFITSEELLECLTGISHSLVTLKLLIEGITFADYVKTEIFDSDVIRQLTFSSLDQPLCPLLRDLTLERCLPNDDDILSDMVMSRWTLFPLPQTVARLCHVSAVFQYHSHAIDARRLKGFYEEGLDGRVKFGSP